MPVPPGKRATGFTPATPPQPPRTGWTTALGGLGVGLVAGGLVVAASHGAGGPGMALVVAGCLGAGVALVLGTTPGPSGTPVGRTLLKKAARLGRIPYELREWWAGDLASMNQVARWVATTRALYPEGPPCFCPTCGVDLHTNPGVIHDARQVPPGHPMGTYHRADPMLVGLTYLCDCGASVPVDIPTVRRRARWRPRRRVWGVEADWAETMIALPLANMLLRWSGADGWPLTVALLLLWLTVWASWYLQRRKRLSPVTHRLLLGLWVGGALVAWGVPRLVAAVLPLPWPFTHLPAL